MPNKKLLRRRKLIKPGLQMRLVAAFAGLATLAMLVQFLVAGFLLMRSASRIEGAGGQLAASVPGTLMIVLAVSLVVLLPLFAALGTLLTFRFAGPVYRFEQYLMGVARGEQLGPCKIRKGDELHSLCEAINQATEAIRRRAHDQRPADGGAQRASA